MSGNLELVKYLDSFKKIDVTIVTIFTIFVIKFKKTIFLITFQKYNISENFNIYIIYISLLHCACEYDNVEVFKYLFSLNKIDLELKDVFDFSNSFSFYSFFLILFINMYSWHFFYHFNFTVLKKAKWNNKDKIVDILTGKS